MVTRDQVDIRACITIDHPVPGLLHSLQARNRTPLDPQRSSAGEPLNFDFGLRVGPGPKYSGDHVQREGPDRRFVCIRIGQAAGDRGSPWSRRMKIDIHNTDPALLDQAIKGGVLAFKIDGTAKDGSPVCATVRPDVKRVVAV